jgi:hypothetical protein
MFGIDSTLYPFIGLILIVWALSKFASWIFGVVQWRYDHPRRTKEKKR